MKITITWHPYPNEKPTGMQRIFYVWRHGFDRGFNMTYNEGWYMNGREYDDVEWWAEMPTPYEEADK